MTDSAEKMMREALFNLVEAVESSFDLDDSLAMRSRVSAARAALSASGTESDGLCSVQSAEKAATQTACDEGECGGQSTDLAARGMTDSESIGSLAHAGASQREDRASPGPSDPIPSSVMTAANRAAKTISDWSPAKQEYAARAVATPPSQPDERPVCKLCGLEDGACICRSIPKQPKPDEVEAIKTALIAAGCDTGDGSYVHAAMDSVIDAILAMLAERRGAKP